MSSDKYVDELSEKSACSYATARIVPANTAEHAARFLVDVLLPLYEAAGWPLQRVLTDWGRRP